MSVDISISHNDNRIYKSGQEGCVCSQKGPDLFCINATDIKAEWLGSEVVVLDVTKSTNSFLKENAAEYSEGTIVIAKEQTEGRGRLGRSWVSQKGDGIWMSVLLRPDITPSQCSGITLVAALALAKALRDVTGLDLLIKWPNDIVCNGKKVVGILTEMSVADSEVDFVIVGIGINVNTVQFPEDIKAMATSLYLEGVENRQFDRIIKAFCVEFEKCYSEYRIAGDMSGLKSEYEAFLVNKDREVGIIEDGIVRKGTAVGINEAGELLFKNDSEIMAVRAGEVSVRGVYGYV